MAPGIGWKRFSFFDEVRSSAQARPPAAVTAACSGDDDDDVWVGCADGLIVCLDRGTSIKITLSAFGGPVRFLNISAGRLVALGDHPLTLKAWSVAALLSGASPPPLATSNVFASSKLPEGDIVAAVASCDSWPTVVVAVGTSTGAIYFFRGDAVKGRGLAPTGTGRHVLRPPSPITALHIVPNSAGSGGASGSGGRPPPPPPSSSSSTPSTSSVLLFATSESSMAAIDASNGRVLVEDDHGAAAFNSAVMADTTGELALPSSDAICFYSADEGRKAAAAVRGRKHAMAAFRLYVVAVTDDDDDGDATAAASSSLATTSSTIQPPTTTASLCIFDASNKLVAAATPGVALPLEWMVAGKRGVTVMDARGDVIRLEERPLSRRLDALIKARAFQLAVRLAVAEHADPKTMADVHRRYGDFLHSKRDFDGAVAQYAATVGFIEPSYVVQRFLDAQRIHHLTIYLEAVHDAGLATPDQTSLLLNCYTKLGDTAKIDAFIARHETPEACRRVDVGAAVAVLRSSDHAEQAARLAAGAGLWEDHLSVLIEECGRPQAALAAAEALPRRRAAAALSRFGKPLLAADPVAFTALLMKLCLPPEGGGGNDETEADDDGYVAALGDYAHLYSDRPADLRYACVAILAMGQRAITPEQTALLYHTLLDLALGGGGGGGGEETTVNNKSGENDDDKKAPRQETPEKHQRQTASAADRAEALDLLRRGWPPGGDPAYDVDRALTTCHLHSFHEGLVFLHTARREPRAAVAVLAAARDWDGVLDACQRYGGDAVAGGEPEVWRDALELLSSPAAGPGAATALRELLARIEALGVMPPMTVLPILARNPHLRLDLVKDAVSRALQADSRAIAATAAEIEDLKQEAEAAEAAVRKLTEEPVVFQSNRDAQTGAPLEAPSIHFLCGHSFNLRTLGDATEGHECPLCAPEHARVKELQKSHRAAAADTDSFFRRLKAAPDGFGLVAEYFGKGMLNNTTTSAAKRM